MGQNDLWLAQVVEEAIEPDLPICDSHHHLRGQSLHRRAPPYMLDDFLADVSSGHNVVATIFVDSHAMYRADGPEAMKPVGEVEFANGVAAVCASGMYGAIRVAAGIIGHADLMLGAGVGEVLDQEIAAAPGRFRGIRHGVNWVADKAIRNHRSNPPPHRFLDQTYREGFAELGRRGLIFEAWCYHPQLPELIDLARAFPDTTIVLNHLGGPLGIGAYAGKRAEVFAVWQKSMAELAACENVVAKLGGLNMDFCGFEWHTRPLPPGSQELMQANRPYLEYAIETFGMRRCFFESNFPSDRISCSYGVLWNSFKRLTSGYSASEKALLYHDNAARIYRLGDRLGTAQS